MRTGITPVVAIALLLGMTVVASGGAYTFFTQATQQGMDEASASLQTELQVRSMRCEDTSAVVGLSNTGDRELTADSASVFLYDEGTLVDTAEKDVTGAAVLQPGGFSELEFPFTTYLSPGTRYTVEVRFPDADYSFERPCQARTGSLIGYWNFDEIDSRTIADLTVNGNDGTFAGMGYNGTVSGLLHNGTLGSGSGSDSRDPSWSSDCHDGDCLVFGTDAEKVNVPDDPGLNQSGSFTWTAWVRPDTVVADGDYMMWASQSGRYAGFLGEHFEAWATTTGAGLYLPSGEEYVAGEWYHYAMTYDMAAGEAAMYVDGKKVAEDTDVSGRIRYPSGSTALHLANYSSYGYQGALDEVRVYDRSLSQEEIVDVMDGAAPGNGIVAYYPFDEGTGQTAWNNAYQRIHDDGRAVRFDGTDDFVEVDGAPDVAATGTQDSFTVSFWMNHTAGTGAIVEWGSSGGSQGNHIWVHDSQDDLYINPNGGCNNGEATGAIVHDEWHHYAVLYDGQDDELRWYRDGELLKTVSESCSPDTVATSIRMGNRGGHSDFLGAALDAVRIYDRAISTSEIQADMNGKPPANGIAAAYSFDGPEGRTVWNNGYWRQGTNGGMVAFDGDDDFISVTNTNALAINGTFTLVTLANPAEDRRHFVLSQHHWRDSDGDGDTNIRGFWFDRSSGGGAHLILGNGSVHDSVVAGAIPTDTWTQMAATFDGSTATVYVNGMAVGSTAVNGYRKEEIRDFTIGSFHNLNDPFNGTLDEVRVYDAALSVQQVSALYNATQ